MSLVIALYPAGIGTVFPARPDLELSPADRADIQPDYRVIGIITVGEGGIFAHGRDMPTGLIISPAAAVTSSSVVGFPFIASHAANAAFTHSGLHTLSACSGM